ncbi:MAG: hypothetical protein OJF58_001237 [Enhydrobacter sp.]|nr:MAG: hypothetical protein OJF58_001237 [Enhydrobacter sp.]
MPCGGAVAIDASVTAPRDAASKGCVLRSNFSGQAVSADPQLGPRDRHSKEMHR